MSGESHDDGFDGDDSDNGDDDGYRWREEHSAAWIIQRALLIFLPPFQVLPLATGPWLLGWPLALPLPGAFGLVL